MSDPTTDYIIDGIIGTGSTSTVYKAQNRNDGEWYAIKIIDISTLKDIDYNMIKNEPFILSKFSTPHILHIKDSYCYNNKFYIVSPLGIGNLSKYIESDEYPIKSEMLTFKIFKQMCLAVKECHAQNIAHRDIKVSNFILYADEKYVLADFGFATENQSHLIDFPGTVFYAAPELIRGIPYDGKKSDIWALGVCLHILYHKTYPFLIRIDQRIHCNKIYSESTINSYSYAVRHNEHHIGRGTPKLLKRLITKCLQKHPDNRPCIDDILTSRWFKAMEK